MIGGIDCVAAGFRLPIVLVVDPEAASRFTLWRLLSPSLGVLEARDGRRARDWLRCGRRIDALVVQKALPDSDGSELVKSLLTARIAAASRAVIVTRPIDLHMVVTNMTSWFFSQDARRADALVREADRLVS